MKRDELLQVRLSKAELLDLRTAAIDAKVTVSELVRTALELEPSEARRSEES